MGRFPVEATRPGATILFGLGSFMLMADMCLSVIKNGDKGGNLFEMGFPSAIGLIGICLWASAVAILVFVRFSRIERSSSGSRSVFLRGNDHFRCRSCGKVNAVRTESYHTKYTCKCGAMHDLFQDGPWDDATFREDGRSAPASKRPTSSDRVRRRPPLRPSR